MWVLKHAQLLGLGRMGLVLAVWLSALPFAAFLLLPTVGIGTMLGTARTLLVALLLLCWERCTSAVTRFYWDETHKTVVAAITIDFALADTQCSGKGCKQHG